MTEIKLQLDDPAEFARYARAHASQIPGAWRGRADQYLSIAEQIEEQVKPAIEEPTEWGSIVRARVDADVEPLLLAYVPNPDESDLDKSQGFPWYSERDSWHTWSDLTEVEVLRVGIGEAQ